MNIILLVILTLIGVTYGLIAAISTAAIICPLKNPDGSYVPDDVEMKRFTLAMILLPISPIIGPYFIYKVLKKGNKKDSVLKDADNSPRKITVTFKREDE